MGGLFRKAAKATAPVALPEKSAATSASAPVDAPSAAPMTAQEQTTVAAQVRRKRNGLGSTMTGAAAAGTTAGSVASKALLGQ